VLEDVAYKVITGMRTPDQSTIAEFRRRHELAIGELFDDVLGVCREARLVSVGVIAIDGTKIKANASMDQNAPIASWSARFCARPRRPTARGRALWRNRGDELAVNDRQVILAAEITVDAPDFGHLEPMLETTLRDLHRHPVTKGPKVLLGDAGYWHRADAGDRRTRDRGPGPAGRHDAGGQPPGPGERLLRDEALQIENHAGPPVAVSRCSGLGSQSVCDSECRASCLRRSPGNASTLSLAPSQPPLPCPAASSAGNVSESPGLYGHRMLRRPPYTDILPLRSGSVKPLSRSTS